MVENQDDEFDGKTNIFTSDTVTVPRSASVPPCLVCLVGPAELIGRQWPLDRPSIVMGRAQTSDIQISEMSLSKTHVKFGNVQNQITLSDMGATNTTLVNEVPCVPHELYTLKNNDRIQTGSVVFKFLQHGLISETDEKARMQGELELARTVQESLLPQNSEAQYGWARLAGVYRTASECSGDWWWHWSIGTKAFALIGDTTGHGAASALMTSAARSAMATIEKNPDVKLEQVYTTLSYAIQSCGGGKLMMSAFIIEIDLATKQYRFINASHIPSLVIPKTAVVATQFVHLSDPISSPLGTDKPNMQVGTKTWDAPCRIVLLTDGLTERPDHKGVMVKERLFYGKVLESHTSTVDSPKKFVDTLLVKSDHLAGMAPQNDDMTIVAIDLV